MPTKPFHYQAGQLYAEQVSVAEIATRFGTPCYVYSRAAIIEQWQAFTQALAGTPHQVCYAVKANSSLAVLQLLAQQGAGFDIVSGGELARVLAAGADPKKIVFSGVGKQTAEIKQALKAGIACFNVESESELLRINDIAGELQQQAAIALRINPDITAGGHAYITTGSKENKFGISVTAAHELYQVAAQLPHLHISGIAYHIGSQLTELAPFLLALDRILELVDELATLGIQFDHVDIGGGLGVCYKDETPPTPAEYIQAILTKVAHRPVKLVFEPGRAIVANAGILLTRVEYLKHTATKNFAIVDAAMNDLVRPALYEAWQEIIPVTQRSNVMTTLYDVVGPVCETGDFLGYSRNLAITANDLLAVKSAGAYGFVMSSNYNTRPRAPEILVDRNQMHLVRRRESIDELLASEYLLP